jgi:hypothetical protein
MEAQLGSNPSFLWRSLLSGRDTLTKGLDWHQQTGHPSRPLWKATKTGIFTVKSAYDMLEAEKQRSKTGECSYMAKLRWLWRKNWKLAVPRKVKHFLWRAYHESLPTNQQLHRRKIRANPLCSICALPEESTHHALWQCPMARNTWALVHGRMQKLPNQGGDFSMFMLWIYQQFTKEEVEDWAITAWSIWNARNSFVQKERQLSPMVIRAEAVSLRRDFLQAKSSIQH